MLGDLEQLVLLALLRVGDGAYGVPIHAELRASAGRDVTLGTIYKTLSRLEDKGYVRSFEGAPTALRGGRRTRCFAMTPTGRRTLRATMETLQRMAAGLDIGLEPGR
jgi:DNA-binding PadR family transcriptional regulator